MDNFPIDLYIKFIDNKNIEDIKLLKKNNSNNNDIVSEVYNNGLLTSERLKFIIKNTQKYLPISSTLIRKLIKENNIDLLDIIFNNFKIFDNKFIITLLYHYKNKISLPISRLNQLTENYKISTKKEKDLWYESNHSVDIFLIHSCLSGNVFLVNYLSKLGIDINKSYMSGKTPLFYACSSGNEVMVKYLIDHGADINKENYKGTTPLFYACSSGNEVIVKYLIEHGADVKKQNKYDITPLFKACESGNENMVKYLIENGADVNKENKYGISSISSTVFCGATPLFYACEGNNVKLVRYLIENGADINKEDKYGQTPLFYACLCGNEAIVKNLVEYGADINKKNIYDKTPLYYAYKNKNENLINYLIKNGAFVNKQNKNDEALILNSIRDELIEINIDDDLTKNSILKIEIDEEIDKFLSNYNNKEKFKAFRDIYMYIIHTNSNFTALTSEEREQYNIVLRLIINLISNKKNLFLNEKEEEFNYVEIISSELIKVLNYKKISKIKERIQLLHNEYPEISKFKMYTSRKPEIQLIKLINDLNIKLYNIMKENKDEFTINTFQINYQFPILQGEEKITEKILFKLPIQYLNKNETTNRKILKKKFTKNLDRLFKIYMSNKYKNTNNDVETMVKKNHDILQYGLFREIAISDPMIYGKELTTFIERNKRIIENLSQENQLKCINDLMNPVDCRYIYGQFVNKISKYLIKKNGIGDLETYEIENYDHPDEICEILETAFSHNLKNYYYSNSEAFYGFNFEKFNRYHFQELNYNDKNEESIMEFIKNTNIYSNIIKKEKYINAINKNKNNYIKTDLIYENIIKNLNENKKFKSDYINLFNGLHENCISTIAKLYLDFNEHETYKISKERLFKSISNIIEIVIDYTSFKFEKLDNEIKQYKMYINRSPEIELVNSLHRIETIIKEKYHDQNFEISENFGFKSYHSEELGDDKDFNIDVDFKIPEKIIVQSTSVSKVAGTFTKNAINDNLSTMESYTDTLDNLIKNYIVKKYKNKISIKEDFKEMQNELEQIGKKRIIAINNPMVYGKNIQRFFNINNNQIEYDKLNLEQQFRIIDAIMDPVDSKKIAMKAINEIARKITIENSESNNQNSDNSELNKSKIILQVNLPQGKELNRQDTDLEGKELSEEDITEIMKEVDNIDKNVIGSFYGFEFKNEKDEYIDLHFDYLPNYSWTYSFNEESVKIEENYEENQKENGKINNLKEKARKNVKYI